MKHIKIYLILLLVSIPIASFAQMVHSSYFLEKWSNRNSINAAFAPEYGYFSLPVLGGVQLGVYSNLGMNKVIFPNPEGKGYVLGLHESIGVDQFLQGFSPNNYLRQNLDLSLLSFGFFGKNSSNFWSFDLSLHEDIHANIPYDLFRLLKEGMVTTGVNEFDFKNLSVFQNNYLSADIGHSRDINDKLRVGAKARFLLGISSEGVHYSKFNLSLSEDLVELETEGDIYIASQFLSLTKSSDGYLEFSDPQLKENYGPAGAGLAFDIGATYKLLPQLELSAAINNLGFIQWGSKNIQRGKTSGSLSFSGVEMDKMEVDSTFIEGLAEKFLFEEVANPTGLRAGLPFDIKLAGEYKIFNRPKRDISIGLLYHHFNSDYYNVNRLVGALNLKPLSWFQLSGTIDIFNPDFNKVGLGLNISPSWLNLFMASDFVMPKLNPDYIPIERIHVNLLFGGAISFGKNKQHRKKVEQEAVDAML